MAAPFVARGLADRVSPPDGPRSPACAGAGFFRGCHGVLDRTTDGVDPQNAQPALHCDRGRDAADAVWRAVSGCGAQGQCRVRVYAVNPRYDEIMGVKSYPSVTNLPEAPDVVAVVVPWDQVLDVLEESHRKGAGSAIVISAGFAERGVDDRRDLQGELGAFASTSGMRISGPNCLGLANVKDDIWATASSRGAEGLTGPIGLVCQSGATAFGPFLVRAVENGIGFSYIISTGNEADLDFTDFARYLLDDPDTRVIAGFVEGFKQADKFLELAKLAAERGKPIVLIKIGRSELGARRHARIPQR